MRFLPLVCLGLALVPGIAHAYVGPGLGVGAIAAVLGVVSAAFLAIFAVVYYPVKRALRKRRAAAGGEQPSAATRSGGTDSGE